MRREKKPDSTAREKIRELAESREKKAKNKKQSVKGKTKKYENFYVRKKVLLRMFFIVTNLCKMCYCFFIVRL